MNSTTSYQRPPQMLAKSGCWEGLAAHRKLKGVEGMGTNWRSPYRPWGYY